MYANHEQRSLRALRRRLGVAVALLIPLACILSTGCGSGGEQNDATGREAIGREAIGDTEPCKLCEGEGMAHCSACGGSGGEPFFQAVPDQPPVVISKHQRCRSCGGDQRVLCPNCLGERRCLPAHNANVRSCPCCSSRGTTSCTTCVGVGKQRFLDLSDIPNWNGEGLPPRGKSGFTKQACAACDGKGVWLCHFCLGTRFCTPSEVVAYSDGERLRRQEMHALQLRGSATAADKSAWERQRRDFQEYQTRKREFEIAEERYRQARNPATERSYRATKERWEAAESSYRRSYPLP